MNQLLKDAEEAYSDAEVRRGGARITDGIHTARLTSWQGPDAVERKGVKAIECRLGVTVLEGDDADTEITIFYSTAERQFKDKETGQMRRARFGLVDLKSDAAVICMGTPPESLQDAIDTLSAAVDEGVKVRLNATTRGNFQNYRIQDIIDDEASSSSPDDDDDDDNALLSDEDEDDDDVDDLDDEEDDEEDDED